MRYERWRGCSTGTCTRRPPARARGPTRARRRRRSTSTGCTCRSAARAVEVEDEPRDARERGEDAEQQALRHPHVRRDRREPPNAVSGANSPSGGMARASRVVERALRALPRDFERGFGVGHGGTARRARQRADAAGCQQMGIARRNRRLHLPEPPRAPCATPAASNRQRAAVRRRLGGEPHGAGTARNGSAVHAMATIRAAIPQRPAVATRILPPDSCTTLAAPLPASPPPRALLNRSAAASPLARFRAGITAANRIERSAAARRARRPTRSTRTRRSSSVRRSSATLQCSASSTSSGASPSRRGASCTRRST